jgi:hypothetical protein
MQKKYEAPALTLIGTANDIVMGSGMGSLDATLQAAPDFEFENDWPLI